VAPERGVVVLFELAPQEPLLFEGGEDAPSSARRNPGERSLPSLLIFSQRLRVVRETEKICTTSSLLGMPRSTAARALILMSFE
jgi:hypothetical protein